MATCTIFKNFSNPVENKSLIQIAKDIISDKYKPEIEEIRKLVQLGKNEEANELKKKLLSFTPSATFKEKRLLPNLDLYSGFVHLDFDKLEPEQLRSAIEIIKSIPYTFLCFVSPSGNGLKVFVEVNTELEHHEIAYMQVLNYYEKETALKADPSCKDVTRLCFFSYDPNAYKNIQSVKFTVNGIERKQNIIEETIHNKETISKAPDQDLDVIFKLEQIKIFTDQKSYYNDGNRNSYIYLFASNANRNGLFQADVENYCIDTFDLSTTEIRATVNSAYKNHQSEFSKFSNVNSIDIEAEPNKTPIKMESFPIDIYENIPVFFQRIVNVGKTNEEKDILLLTSIVTLSVALPNLYGFYRDDKVYSNLYLFISAIASGGKGIINHCRKLIYPIHQDLKNQAKFMKKNYELELNQFNNSRGSDLSSERPKKPPQKMLFIPANNSSSGFMELIGDNEGRGIIFETEADTLAKSFKSDYGNFNDELRRAFQHEPITFYRRTDKEHVDIESPFVSLVLSGTPKQIINLIPDSENGLFSRFIFYSMNFNLEWQNVFQATTENGLNDYFSKLGNEFYDFYKTLSFYGDILFTLSPQQQSKFNSFFESKQNLYFVIQSSDIIGTVRRLGLISFRIMMIFSAIRKMEHGDFSSDVTCDDTDFDTVLIMIEILLKHSSYIFTQISHNSYKPKPINKKEQFLNDLPYSFNRQDYVAIALHIGISDKTAQRYLKEFCDNKVINKNGHDSYLNPNAIHPSNP